MSEWQKDENGRYYRMIGNCKEYAPEMVFAHAKQDPAAIKAEIAKENAKKTGKYCPFKSGLSTECLRDCPLYGANACILAMQGKAPAKETKGANCPLYKKKCGEDCAFYGKGCGLHKIVNGLYAGKEN